MKPPIQAVQIRDVHLEFTCIKCINEVLIHDGRICPKFPIHSQGVRQPTSSVEKESRGLRMMVLMRSNVGSPLAREPGSLGQPQVSRLPCSSPH